jgi:hypothetical protein
MINPKINQEIISLWHKYFDKYEPGKTPVSSKGEFDNVKAPMFYAEPKQGGILFIGMNPSSVNDDVSKKIKEKFFDFNNPKLLWQNFRNKSDEDVINMIVNIEEEMINGEKPYRYFIPMKTITKSVGLKNEYFQHVDLFLYRERNQPSFIKKIGKEYVKFNKFGMDQMEIFDKVLTSLNPEVIVVANAKASEIFRDKYKDELSSELDESLGFHFFKKKIPIFFSGMLTGQRVLDKHSRERLDWHIKKSLLP